MSKDQFSKLRVRDADRSQQAILVAARDEFAQHGLGGARVDRIAQRVKLNKPLAPRPEREVADVVWHVWIADDPARALEELRDFLPGNQTEIDRLEAEQRDRYPLQVLLPDRSLQELVNRYHDLGLSLLSPAAPQPGVSNVKLSGKMVQYEVDFVRK